MHIVQDQFGFIWLGTSNGLCRFDGQDFLQFRYDPEDVHSISSNYITALYLDRQQNLWVSTNNGLNRLNTINGQLDRIDLHFPRPDDTPQSVGAVVEDEERNIWVGVQDYGLVKLTPEKDRKSFRFTLMEANAQDTSKIADSYVSVILEDRSGYIWVCLRNGVDRINPKTGEIRHFRHPLLGNDPGKNLIRHAVMDNAGTILLTFRHSGIFQISTTAPDPEIQPHFPKKFQSSLPEGVVYNKMMIGRNGQLWVGTTTHGVLLVDSSRSSYQLLAPEPQRTGSLSSSDIRSLLQGKAGNIWIGTGNAGLNRGKRVSDEYRLLQNDPADSNTPSPGQIFAIAGGPQDNLWLGHLGTGVDQFRINEQHELVKVRNFRHDPGGEGGLTGNDIICLITGQEGGLWIGTNGQGLNKLNPETGKIEAFLYNPQDTASISGNRIWAICEDQNGYIWVGGYQQGLSRLDSRTGVARRFRHKAGDPTSLASDNINALLTDSKGKIWIGTHSGLDQLDPVTGKFTHYTRQSKNPSTLSNNLIYSLYEDPDGHLWVGTNLGLNRLIPVYTENKLTYEIKRYFEKDGLPSNTIYNIQSDNFGNIWVGTDAGLAKMAGSQSKVSFVLLNNEDGLENEGVLLNAHYNHEKSGWLFFGNSKGLLAFHPNYLKQKEYDYGSGLLLSSATRFQRDGLDLKMRTDHFIHGQRSLHLGPDDQAITFNLSDLNWTKDRRYEYQFRGFNEQWIPIKDKMEVTFTNLAPGDYTLLMRARSWDDYATPEARLLDILVTPPWWKSRWAFFFYALAAFSILFLLRRFELRRRKLKQQAEVERARVEEKQRQAERIEMQADKLEQSFLELQRKNKEILIAQNQLIQQEKLASLGQLTAGIAHEIKNPLNFINNFAEGSIDLLDELLEELANEEQHISEEKYRLIKQVINELAQNSTDIKENGVRVDRIIRSMMDHARETGNERRPTDLNRLIDDNINLAYQGYRALDPGFNCIIEKNLDPRIGLINIFPQALSRVLLNLLNNACYAVGEKQKLAVSDYQARIWVLSRLISPLVASGTNQIEIRIKDNGIGIPNTINEKIFEPFYTSKPAGSGNAGLGLSISYDIIVKQHQGQLIVESEEGVFTEFTIQLSTS
ncbi:MAG: hypothetical protein KDD01_05715 [Phaeodactylibacter sp.]|nr:hypothetical protein [Phaeodactylibacter sp.]